MSVFPARSALLAVLAAGLAVLAALLPARDAGARSTTAAHGGSHTNIYVVSPHGGRATVITSNHEGEEDHLAYDPSWSPDGRRLVFTEVRCHSCASEIHVVSARPAHGRSLGRQIASGFRPRWSPDGKRIAFVGIGGGIYVMDADGSHRRLLVKRGLANDMDLAGRPIPGGSSSPSRRPPRAGGYTASRSTARACVRSPQGPARPSTPRGRRRVGRSPSHASPESGRSTR